MEDFSLKEKKIINKIVAVHNRHKISFALKKIFHRIVIISSYLALIFLIIFIGRKIYEMGIERGLKDNIVIEGSGYEYVTLEDKGIVSKIKSQDTNYPITCNQIEKIYIITHKDEKIVLIQTKNGRIALIKGATATMISYALSLDFSLKL